MLEINESQFIALFVLIGSIKKLLSIDYVNIYPYSRPFSIDFAQWKSVVLPHTAQVLIKCISKAFPN